MRRGGSLAVIAIITLSILAPVLAFPAKAATIPLSEVQQAIDLGVQAVLDAVRPIIVGGSYKYVMPDHPSPTIIVVESGEASVPGSQLDPGQMDYEVELVTVTANSVSWRYKFNVDGDKDKDVVIYAELRNIDYNTDKLTIYVEKSEYTLDLIVGSEYPYRFNSVTQGWSTVIYIDESNDYKFHSARYVDRHSTIIAAWLLDSEGYSYTAALLYQFWRYVAGYSYDVYAPMFGKSKNYPDNFFDYRVETWLGNGYDAKPWTTSPSDNYINYPYKSRMYILDSANMFGVALDGWKQMPLAKLLTAMHLLDKYGLSRKSEAEQLIAEALQEGGWDGYGLKKGVIYGTAFFYKGYPVYLNAALLAALVKYYNVTGDRWINGQDILYMADRLAGILVRLQWKYEHETPWGTVRLALFRGWWPAAYDIGSLIAKPSAWGIIDTATSGWDSLTGFLAEYLGVDVGEALRPMPSEWPFAIVNSESTILAIQALKLYLQLAQELGRQPLDPTTPPMAGTEGSFVEGGGGGSGLMHYGETDGGGLWIYAMAITGGLTGDAWHYQYAKYKLNVKSSGYYYLEAWVLVRYHTYDSLGSSARGVLVFKVINSAGTVISQLEIEAFNVDAETWNSGATTETVKLSLGYLAAGTYYVEVGLKVIADNNPVSFDGAVVHAWAHPDYVALIQG